jgi:putative endonuclease
MKKSYVYILSNKNKSVLYIGVSSNLVKRIEEHKNSEGSIFTKKYNVIELVYFEEFTEINEAIKREKQLKKWNRSWKWNLIKEFNPNLIDLYDEIMLE